MQRSLQHRGPDGAGQWHVRLPNGLRIGFAHTRLAILDLSNAGHQPMLDAAGESCITYNGEVYNHQELRRKLPPREFTSQSDTETLLAAWCTQGPEAIHSFRGMFAFGLYDHQRQQLVLARDRLGIKPLYVCRADRETWLFASEVRAIVASGLLSPEINRPSVESYLAFGALTAPQTLLAGIESLTPAELWTYDLRNISDLEPVRKTYWHPMIRATDEQPSTRDAAVEALRPRLVEAIRLRMLSDVPVGVFLSGGIDSSTIVASLAHQGFHPLTFSVTFAESTFDESEFAEAVAKEYGTQHVSLRLEPDAVLSDLDEAWRAYDQPSIDGINSYFISRCVRQLGVKVALSGLGGDEVFAGYPTFRQINTIRNPLVASAAFAVRWIGQRVKPNSSRWAKLARLVSKHHNAVACNSIVREVLSPSRRSALLERSVGEPSMLISESVRQGLESLVCHLDPVNAHSCCELLLYMANMLLRDTDQMSMAHALEVRVPLLDHRLVELVAPLPGAWKLAKGRAGRQKGLLLDALDPPLDCSLVERKKMGFVFPWEQWLRHQLKDRVSQVLHDRSTLERVGLNSTTVLQIWNDFLQGRPGTRYTDILCLVHLLVWVAKNGGK